MSILVIDVGTSSVRAAVVAADATVGAVNRAPLPPSTPAPGLVEFDAEEMATEALAVAGAALAEAGPVRAVGITNQRASAVVWDAATGKPLGPGIGWQDLRTAGTCLELQGEGIRLAPNETATKVAWLLDNFDPVRSRDLRWGTVDSWIAWKLTEGRAHATDPSNAAITGLLASSGERWNTGLAERLGIPASSTPRLVDSAGILAPATALPGAPPIAGLIGDQQASLVGQGCTRPGLAKITFGTGAMLDMFVGDTSPAFDKRGPSGCYRVIAWRKEGVLGWGLEATVLSAGTAVEWLVDDMEMLSSPEESAAVAGRCSDSGGVVMVPALLGLGTPGWDFGARGALLGLTRGSTRAQVVRAVLEGVAHRGVDLLEAAERDSGRSIASIRVDGGMAANDVFVQALADAAGRPVEVSPQLEATTLGAGLVAGLAAGVWEDEEELAATWAPRRVFQPSAPSAPADRERWRRAVDKASSWYPELTALQF